MESMWSCKLVSSVHIFSIACRQKSEFDLILHSLRHIWLVICVAIGIVVASAWDMAVSSGNILKFDKLMSTHPGYDVWQQQLPDPIV